MRKQIAASLLLVSQLALAASALGPVDPKAMTAAWDLYNQKKFAASADAFEALIKSSTPNARLYYYAALANRACNRNARGKQLCQYIASTFVGSTEASYAQKLYPEAPPPAPPTTSDAAAAVPDALKGKSVAELMKTEEGRKAVEEALAKKEAAAAASKAKVSAVVAQSKGGRPGAAVFSAEEIEKLGAGGIDQMYYPNCWFESSMSALAMLPRGRRLLSEMIRHGAKPGTFVVRFPGDGKEYPIDEEKLEKSGIHNKALWASLIECAQTMKFPDDDGGYLSDGLACLSGRPAETLRPSSASEQELTRFIQGAVTAQNPIICGTGDRIYGLPRLVFPSHAYTIVGFEPATGLIKIRNPHGINSERFVLSSDPTHRKFEQLNDGVFKMHVSLFQQYFDEIARSNI